MKLLVLGATGQTGRQIVAQAVAAGHDVRALVRSPEKAGFDDPAIVVEKGDATSAQDVVKAARGVDAVLIALGSPSTKSDIASQAVAAVVPALHEAGVHRVVVLSAYGVGASLKEASFLQRMIMGTMMKTLYADKAVADEQWRNSGLDWTLVYPVTLSDGPLTGTYRVLPRLQAKGMPRISRADVAHFMITQAADASWIRRTATLTP